MTDLHSRSKGGLVSSTTDVPDNMASRAIGVQADGCKRREPAVRAQMGKTGETGCVGSVGGKGFAIGPEDPEDGGIIGGHGYGGTTRYCVQVAGKECQWSLLVLSPDCGPIRA